jgi:Na+/H+-dicarboxylate symporter
MGINSPNRRASVVTAIAVLFLAFTVLGWGTAYKMSLYHRAGDPSSGVPIAKLLSQKERPSAAKVVESLLPASPNHQPSGYCSAIIIVALMFGLQLTFSGLMLEAGLDDSRKQRSAHTSYFSFRPPPAFLPSN